jgi:hypothetical protein
MGIYAGSCERASVSTQDSHGRLFNQPRTLCGKRRLTGCHSRGLPPRTSAFPRQRGAAANCNRRRRPGRLGSGFAVGHRLLEIGYTEHQVEWGQAIAEDHRVVLVKAEQQRLAIIDFFFYVVVDQSRIDSRGRRVRKLQRRNRKTCQRFPEHPTQHSKSPRAPLAGLAAQANHRSNERRRNAVPLVCLLEFGSAARLNRLFYGRLR